MRLQSMKVSCMGKTTLDPRLFRDIWDSYKLNKKAVFLQ